MSRSFWTLTIFTLLLFLVGCTKDQVDYNTQLQTLRQENEQLKASLKTSEEKLIIIEDKLKAASVELINVNSKQVRLLNENKQLDDARTSVQIADRTSRKIMTHITNGEFDILRTEYNAEFELNEQNDEILFTKLHNNSYFPTDIFGKPMYVANIVSHEDGYHIGYFISYDPEKGDALVYFKYDTSWSFEYITWGH